MVSHGIEFPILIVRHPMRRENSENRTGVTLNELVVNVPPITSNLSSAAAKQFCGRDTPVSVKMDVDVYQFAKQASAPARAEGAP